MDLLEFPAIPQHIKELLFFAIPFVIIALGAAAAMFLARDYLAKPNLNRRNGNGNGNGRNGNGNRRTYRNTSGNGNSHANGSNGGNGSRAAKYGDAPSEYAYGAELAIPTLAQPGTEQGEGVSTRMENWFSRLLYESGATFPRDVAFMTELAGGLLVGGILFLWLENIFVAVLGFFVGMGTVIGVYMFARSRRKRIMHRWVGKLHVSGFDDRKQ